MEGKGGRNDQADATHQGGLREEGGEFRLLV